MCGCIVDVIMTLSDAGSAVRVTGLHVERTRLLITSDSKPALHAQGYDTPSVRPRCILVTPSYTFPPIFYILWLRPRPSYQVTC